MRRAAVLLALAGALLGCSGGLPSPPIVNRFRLLAIRATPPVVAPGATAALNLLLADPQAGRPITYLWAACATAPGETSDACVSLATDGLPAATLAGCDGVSLTGGGLCLAGDAAAASLAVPTDFLAAGAAARALTIIVVAATGATDAVGCALAVGANGTLPIDCEIGLTTLLVSTSTTDENPGLANLTLDDVSLAADGSSTATGGAEHTLVATAADGTDTTQTLRLTWYLMTEDPTGAPPGSFSDFQTTLGGDAERWTTPVEATRVALWVVIADGQGGVGWLGREVQVTAGP